MPAPWAQSFASVLSFVVLLASGARAEKPRPAHAAHPAAPAPATTAQPSAAPRNAGASSDEKGVQGGSKAAATSAGNANVVATEEGKEGVKTYKFGAVEVESRLRSPELIYFLRRVRAEFDAGDLGHRSFMLELADTEHSAAFR